jgi:ketosteroid isomerase-like protein
MLSWLSKKVISFVMGRTRKGDIRPTLLLDAPDVELTFPGANSWSGVFRGKGSHEKWLERFAAIGIQIYPDEVVAGGFPWRTIVCVRGRDFLHDDRGNLVYENRYVIWGRLAWGRMKELEVYEDTSKADALDRWLAEHRPEVAGPGVAPVAAAA